MRRPFSPLLAPGLALAGVLLWGYAIGSNFGYVARGPTPTENALMTGGLFLGLACHLGAVGVSLVRWRRERRWPVVALLYGAVVVAGMGAGLWASGEDERFLRTNPGSFSIEPSMDPTLIVVRDAKGEWEVPFNACPDRMDDPAGGRLGALQRDGTAYVSYGSDVYYMRLHVAERRVECFGPDGPPPSPDSLRIRIRSPAAGITTVDLDEDTLVYRQRAPGQSGEITTTRAVPTAADWRAFRAMLDSVRVWQWHDRYDDPGTGDGTTWSVKIWYLDVGIDTEGRDRYPGPRGEPRDGARAPGGGSTRTAEFDRVTQAVERLAGQEAR